MKRLATLGSGWNFFFAVVALYVISFFFFPGQFSSSLEMSQGLFLKLIPVFILVFFLLAIANFLIKPKLLADYMGHGSGLKGWVISILAGIISTGPIYMWYPLLNEMQKHGVRNGVISTFLYARAVKMPLFPILVLYFGIFYAILLFSAIIVAAPLQGLLTEKLMEVMKNENSRIV